MHEGAAPCTLSSIALVPFADGMLAGKVSPCYLYPPTQITQDLRGVADPVSLGAKMLGEFLPQHGHPHRYIIPFSQAFAFAFAAKDASTSLNNDSNSPKFAFSGPGLSNSMPCLNQSLASSNLPISLKH